MPDQTTIDRARLLLWSILSEARNALGYLHGKPPRLFARGLSRLVLNPDRLKEVEEKLDEATGMVDPRSDRGADLDWNRLEQVGLTGGMMELKADLIYQTLGKPKPTSEQATSRSQSPVLTYPEGKPIWSRFLKYLRSLLESLINGIANNEKMRLILDFIREYVNCVDGSLKFVQSEQEA